MENLALAALAAATDKFSGDPKRTYLTGLSISGTVPVEGSRKLNEALKAAGGDVRYTEYPGVGHNSWDKAYAEPELMTWMLSKSL